MWVKHSKTYCSSAQRETDSTEMIYQYIEINFCTRTQVCMYASDRYSEKMILNWIEFKWNLNT